LYGWGGTSSDDECCSFGVCLQVVEIQDLEPFMFSVLEVMYTKTFFRGYDYLRQVVDKCHWFAKRA